MKKALEEFGFDCEEISYDSLLVEGRILRLGVPPLRIEILNKLSGVDFSDCYKRRACIDLDGLEVSMISFDDMIANKRAAGRAKDLADLEYFQG